MADSTLQKCPFEHVVKDCGHHPYRTKDEHGWYIVQCTCGARGPFTPRDMDVEAWNRPDALEGVRERAPNISVMPCRSCIKLYACINAGDDIKECREHELFAARA
jgi:hypothetical protein